MSDVAIAGLGIAVGTLGPTLIIMTNIRGGSRDFVFGTAFVREASPLPPVGVAGRCDFELFVNAHGVDGASVRLRDPAVPVNKWPEVGASLPVMVDARDPRHLRILWDEVRTRREIELDRRTAAQHVSDTSAESDTDAADADLFILNDPLLNDTGTDDTGPNDDDAKPPSARP
ncbi:MAG: hypothetical protein JXA67_18420, partial [Micromonosporaceae bacterium]|nr:hypothetical protein [Micromonosporaceae bacterium]